MQQNYSNLKEAWNICFEGSEFPLWVQMGESKSLTSLLWGWLLGQKWALPECRHLQFPQKVPSLWSDSAWFLSRVRISYLVHMQCYILLIKKQNKKTIHAHTCRIFTCRELTTSCFLFIFTRNDLWNGRKIPCQSLQWFPNVKHKFYFVWRAADRTDWCSDCCDFREWKCSSNILLIYLSLKTELLCKMNKYHIHSSATSFDTSAAGYSKCVISHSHGSNSVHCDI